MFYFFVRIFIGLYRNLKVRWYRGWDRNRKKIFIFICVVVIVLREFYKGIKIVLKIKN